MQDGGGDVARALLADVHLALGEVALESETYDKAVIDMRKFQQIDRQCNKENGFEQIGANVTLKMSEILLNWP